MTRPIRLGVAPIAWSNNDMLELGGDTPLETCLRESRKAGFSGTETGVKFPMNPKVLSPILAKHRLNLARLAPITGGEHDAARAGGRHDGISDGPRASRRAPGAGSA